MFKKKVKKKLREQTKMIVLVMKVKNVVLHMLSDFSEFVVFSFYNCVA